MKEIIKDEAITWVSCEKEGLTKEEESKLKIWLKSKVEHKLAYEEAKEIQNIFKNMPNKYSEQLSIQAHRSVKSMNIMQKIKPLLAYAAIFLLVFLGAVKSYEYYTPSFEASFSSNKNLVKKHSLPDGSFITLDLNSTLDVIYSANKREVILKKGQAVFDIAKDKQRPFSIVSGKTFIEVVGTRFEVQKAKNITTIKVEEGIVKVGNIYNENKAAKILIRLKKAEKIVLNNKGKITYLGKTPLELIATWREGLLIFDKSTINQAFQDFSKYHDIEVELQEDIGEVLFSGKFRTDGLDKFLNALEKVYSYKISRNENKIIVSKP